MIYNKNFYYKIVIIMLLYNKNLKQIARKLRSNPTNAENILWRYVRKKQIYDIQFYRQKVIGNYIVDFFAPSINLVIEVDGWYHNFLEQRYQDQERDAYFNVLDVFVLRLSNQQIEDEIDNAIQIIKTNILKLHSKIC
jgi:very-short-patch-repair endonuclease